MTVFIDLRVLNSWKKYLEFIHVFGHGVKVGPGPRDTGPRDPVPPSKFKNGTRDPPKV